MKLEIPILRKIAEEAKRFVSDPRIAELLAELELCRYEKRTLKQEMLIARGVECLECGRRYIPSDASDWGFCSLGCRANARQERPLIDYGGR